MSFQLIPFPLFSVETIYLRSTHQFGAHLDEVGLEIFGIWMPLISLTGGSHRDRDNCTNYDEYTVITAAKTFDNPLLLVSLEFSNF